MAKNKPIPDDDLEEDTQQMLPPHTLCPFMSRPMTIFTCKPKGAPNSAEYHDHELFKVMCCGSECVAAYEGGTGCRLIDRKAP